MKKNVTAFRLFLTIVSSLLLVAIVLVAIRYPATSQAVQSTYTADTSEEMNASATPTAEDTSFEDFQSILSDVTNQINSQQEVEKNILQELQSGLYTFDNPLIIVDPYNDSPLTALVVFSSPEPLNISIHVEGKDEFSGVDFSFDGYNQQHLIPVYGLYAGVENIVSLYAKNQDGMISEKRLKISTESLPEELADLLIQTDSPTRKDYQPGFNFTFENNQTFAKSAFDIDGNFRWFLNDDYLLASEYYFKDHYIFARGSGNFGDVLLIETNPLGRIYNVYFSPYGVHHDIERYKDNLLITGSSGELIQNTIYEIDTQTGQIVNTLDLQQVLPRSRQAGFMDARETDWTHLNAITWVENEDKILVSSRNESTVSKISWPEGKIDWILGPHYAWLPMFEQYLLTPIGEDFTWQFNQHAPEILPDMDNNPDTMDVLLFDNGTLRFKNPELAGSIENSSSEGFSRIVQYRINEKEMTIEQIWQFGEEYGSVLNSPTRGDANLLPNGNRLGVFAVTLGSIDSDQSTANFFEVTDQDQVVWSAQVTNRTADMQHIEYRLERMNIYNSSANDLGIGTIAGNFVPQDIYSKYSINP